MRRERESKTKSLGEGLWTCRECPCWFQCRFSWSTSLIGHLFFIFLFLFLSVNVYVQENDVEGQELKLLDCEV